MTYPRSILEVPRGADNIPVRWYDENTDKWIPRYGQSFVVPLDMAAGESDSITDLRNSVADQLASIVSLGSPMPIDQVVVRDILPFTDLAIASGPSGTTDTWGPGVAITNSANVLQTWCAAKTLPNQPATALGIFGMLDTTPNPKLARFQFKLGADVIALANLESSWSNTEQGPIGIVRPTAIWRPGQQVTILVMNNATGAITETIIPLGFIAEPRSQNVAPPVPSAPTHLPAAYGGI